MHTLHVKRLTPRVIANRVRKPQIAWPNFEYALRRELVLHPEMKGSSRIWWQHQLLLWNRGYRGLDLNPITRKVAERILAFPMGH